MTSRNQIDDSGTQRTTFVNLTSTHKRLANKPLDTSNRHDVSIIWLDTTMDPNDLHTQSLLNQLNDRVELFNELRDCLNYLYECEETTLLIISGECATQCLSSIHSIPSIDSIIIFCASPKKYHHLTNDTHMKILGCITSETELIQCVQKWMDLKCQIHFYTWSLREDHSTALTRQTAPFLANYLLPNCIDYYAYGNRKQEMLKICQEYYVQSASEYEHIQEFELTYTRTDAIHWYTRNSFVHKTVNRALRLFDHTKLRAIAFYIRDLRSQLRERRLTSNAKEAITVYHGLVMTLSDVRRIQSIPKGSLLSNNGFLSTSRKREIVIASATKEQNTPGQPLCNVLLEIHLDVDNSPIVCADIGQISAYPEEDEILFDMGNILCLQDVIYDEQTQFYIVQLTLATHTDYNSIEQLLKIVKYQLDEPVDDGEQMPLIGKLLSRSSQLDEQVKKQDDYWQKFSVFRSMFNNLWDLNHEKYRHALVEHMPWIPKLRRFFQNYEAKMVKFNGSDARNLAPYDELSLARFEPILYFRLNEHLIQQQRENLSSIFHLQYRRFISQHLSHIEMEENLEEYYHLYYISSELPLHMEENLRVKYYQLKISSDNDDPAVRTKLIERLISQLLHDLGRHYANQAAELSDQQENRTIAKALRAKGAKCYELLANETEKIVQRYKIVAPNQ